MPPVSAPVIIFSFEVKSGIAQFDGLTHLGVKEFKRHEEIVAVTGRRIHVRRKFLKENPELPNKLAALRASAAWLLRRTEYSFEIIRSKI